MYIKISINLIKIRSLFRSEIQVVAFFSNYQNFGAKKRSDFNQIDQDLCLAIRKHCRKSWYFLFKTPHICLSIMSNKT